MKVIGRIENYIFAISLASLMFLRGGFGMEAACGVGAVCMVLALANAIIHRKAIKEAGTLVVPAFAAVALVYIVSAVSIGSPLLSLGGCGAWAGVAAAAIYGATSDSGQREHLVRVMTWLGVGISTLGVLVFAGVLAWDGGVDSNRLQFPMTYANSAGVLYGATALLCFFSVPKGSLSKNSITNDESVAPVDSDYIAANQPALTVAYFACLPLAALFATKSGGAFVAFALVAIVICVAWFRRKCYQKITFSAIEVLVAAILFFVADKLGSTATLVVIIACIALCILGARLATSKMCKGAVSTRINTLINIKVAIAAVACIVMAAVAVAVTFAARAGEAASNLAERLLHVMDATTLLSQSPLLGIGPDMWQFAYQHVQTAQYRTTVVHCSYMQVALDGGLVALLLLVCAIAAGVRALYKSREWGALAAVALVLVHSLVDFDMQFSMIVLPLAYLLAKPMPRRSRTASGGILAATNAQELSSDASMEARVVSAQPAGAFGLVAKAIPAPTFAAQFAEILRGRASLLVSLVISVLLACVGVGTASARMALALAYNVGDMDAYATQFESSRLAWHDPELATDYINALVALGCVDEACEFANMSTTSYDAQVLSAAQAYIAAGDSDHAADLLLTEMAASPYDEGFYQSAHALMQDMQLDDFYKDKFNYLVKQYNEKAGEGHALWLSTQTTLDLSL
jgi:hypothetical protein